MQLKIEIDTEMIERLTAQAVNEKRSIPRQAEVILRKALGLPFPRVQPIPTKEASHERQPT
jgi:hypothetical protein